MTKTDFDGLFSRGVATLIDPDGTFRKNVEAKARSEYAKDIVIKLGIDPTRPDIHLGHAVILRKLRALQDIGCKVIFLVGDFTAQIGDPTGKSKVRPEIEQKEIEKNLNTYIGQVDKILKTTPEVFSWIRNSDWLYSLEDLAAPAESLETSDRAGNKLTIDFPENSFFAKAIAYEKTRMQNKIRADKGVDNITLRGLLWTLRGVTHARLIERDMFQERIRNGEELHINEMLYPVLQGIDSSVLHKIYGSCDLEIGGTDQTFNMLMGRDIMKMNKQPEQAVMALDILEGLDGKEKMSKSLDNYVSVADEPNDMYGKIMSIPDPLIPRYFLLCTYTPTGEVSEIEKKLLSGDVHPKDVKMRLAREIVAIYHGDKSAKEAEAHFVATFSKKEIPEQVTEISLAAGKTIIDAMIEAKCAESKSEARRLVEAGAVTQMDKDEKITDASAVPFPGTYRVGKIRFFRING